MLVIFTSVNAFAATNGSVSISGGGTYRVLDQAGNLIVPDNPAAPANFLFLNSYPAPNASGTAFTPSGYSQYTASGGFPVYRYDFSGTGNVYLLALASDNLHYAIISSGNYYTGSSWAASALALSGTEAKDYFISGTTDHLKATPNAPLISIQESQIRIDQTSSTETTLIITVTAQNGTSPNLIDVGGNTTGNYALQIIRSGDTSLSLTVFPSGADINGAALINQNSGTFTVKGPYLQTGQAYTITAWNRNWFSPDDTAIGGDKKTTVDWTLLGAGAPPMTFNIPLTPNYPLSMYMISMPYNLDYTNGQAIADDINAAIVKDGATGVSEVDRFNRELQRFEGVSYNADLGFWVFDPPETNFPIIPGEGYILYYRSDIMNWTPRVK